SRGNSPPRCPRHRPPRAPATPAPVRGVRALRSRARSRRPQHAHELRLGPGTEPRAVDAGGARAAGVVPPVPRERVGTRRRAGDAQRAHVLSGAVLDLDDGVERPGRGTASGNVTLVPTGLGFGYGGLASQDVMPEPRRNTRTAA